VFVPEENRIAREGDGLKIALSTLNTGRLALMANAVGVAKWATKIAREWATERVQWGRPIGKHDAVAQKIAFIAGSAFGLEAMLDVAARLADDKANDVRIEAALCKLYQSFLGRIVDIGGELFAISAAVCYADTIGRERPDAKTEAVELAELFSQQAKRRAETLFDELWANDDDANYAAAQGHHHLARNRSRARAAVHFLSILSFRSSIAPSALSFTSSSAPSALSMAESSLPLSLPLFSWRSPSRLVS
jgi:hypothetical protein